MLLWDYWDNPETSAQWVGGSLLLLRNVAIAAAFAKLVTNNDAEPEIIEIEEEEM